MTHPLSVHYVTCLKNFKHTIAQTETKQRLGIYSTCANSFACCVCVYLNVYVWGHWNIQQSSELIVWECSTVCLAVAIKLKAYQQEQLSNKVGKVNLTFIHSHKSTLTNNGPFFNMPILQLQKLKKNTHKAMRTR